MNHNWYAVITAKVLCSKEINDKQKLLIALISNLSNEKGYCFASNKYLGECLDCSESTIRQNISVLEEKGFLGRIIKLRADNSIEYRSLTIIESSENTNNPPVENRSTPSEILSFTPSEILSHNNKYINNKEEYNIVLTDILNCLNKEVGSEYRVSSKKTQTLILSRLKEGFKPEQFKEVIKYKSHKWLNDEKYRMYLRPETLFGSKMESYLEEMKMDKSYSQSIKPKKEYSSWS